MIIISLSTVIWFQLTNNNSNNIWNMKVTVVAIVIGALGTIPKGLVKESEDLESEDKWRPSKLHHY